MVSLIWRGGGDDRAHLGAGDRADVVDREHVRRVGHRDDEPAVLPADRDRLVAAGERLGDERRDRTVDRAVVEVDELEADLAGQGADELRFGDGPRLDQEAAERLAAPGLFGQRRVELGVGEQSFVYEQAPSGVASPTGGPFSPSIHPIRGSELDGLSTRARDCCTEISRRVVFVALTTPAGRRTAAGTHPGREARRRPAPARHRGRRVRRRRSARVVDAATAATGCRSAGSIRDPARASRRPRTTSASGHSGSGARGSGSGSGSGASRSARARAPASGSGGATSGPRDGRGSITPTAPASTSSSSTWHTSITGRAARCTSSRTVRRPSIATRSAHRSRSMIISSTSSASSSRGRHSSDGMTRRISRHCLSSRSTSTSASLSSTGLGAPPGRGIVGREPERPDSWHTAAKHRSTSRSGARGPSSTGSGATPPPRRRGSGRPRDGRRPRSGPRRATGRRSSVRWPAARAPRAVTASRRFLGAPHTPAMTLKVCRRNIDGRKLALEGSASGTSERDGGSHRVDRRGRPLQSSTCRAAWCTSMPRPPTTGAPSPGGGEQRASRGSYTRSATTCVRVSASGRDRERRSRPCRPRSRSRRCRPWRPRRGRPRGSRRRDRSRRSPRRRRALRAVTATRAGVAERPRDRPGCTAGSEDQDRTAGDLHIGVGQRTEEAGAVGGVPGRSAVGREASRC